MCLAGLHLYKPSGMFAQCSPSPRQYYEWIFTLQVWFREGIHPRVPEGSSWEEVEVPKEVAQISAGPGDLLWALLWDGSLLVRTGLSLDSPTGVSQIFINPPNVSPPSLTLECTLLSLNRVLNVTFNGGGLCLLLLSYSILLF